MRTTLPHLRFILLIAAGIFGSLSHAWLATSAMKEKSTTGDEIAHLTGGYNFNHWDDYRMHPENGILPQRWQTLPMMFSGVNYPSNADDAWRKSDVWLMGYRFFYQSGNDLGWMLASARAMNSCFGALTTFVVFAWSFRLWGKVGALVSLLFCALCPTMLAHSSLATSDMCMTLFFLLSPAAYWQHLNKGTIIWWIISPLLLGLAAVAKYSALMLVPIMTFLGLLRLFQNKPIGVGSFLAHHFWSKILIIGASLVVHVLAVFAVIWMFFGFRFSAFNPQLPAGVFTFPWEQMLSFGGVKARAIELFRTYRLLPEGYLYGLAFVLRHAEARGAFLDGEYSIHGWILFFPKAFLYKTPPSLLLGLIASGVFVGLKLRATTAQAVLSKLWQVAPLVILFFIYWLFSLTSHLNIGHRHLLPTYPVLYIFCGALGWAAQRAWERSHHAGRILFGGITAVLCWHASIAAAISPHYLAYFSPVAGGPTEGYKHLVDSSLDWGQDLPGLKKWTAFNLRPNESFYLSYFGTGEPEYYGIHAIRMEMLPDFVRFHPWYKCEPGVYALSASMLQHVYASLRGDWTLENERQYQQLRLSEGVFSITPGEPATSEVFKNISKIERETAWRTYSQLRFARLCHYLRARQPDDMIGYSILIYRLDQTELDAALNRDLRDWAAAIEHKLGKSFR